MKLTKHQRLQAARDLEGNATIGTGTHKYTREVAVHARGYKPVYEAIRAKLDAETTLRKKRSLNEWILAERECVLGEVNHQRALLAYDPVDLATIERVEHQAVGHVDYVSKYAHAAADLVFRKETT